MTLAIPFALLSLSLICALIAQARWMRTMQRWQKTQDEFALRLSADIARLFDREKAKLEKEIEHDKRQLKMFQENRELINSRQIGEEIAPTWAKEPTQ